MSNKKPDSVDFFNDLSDYQISAQEFFSPVLLDYIKNTFGWEKVLFTYYDTQGNFLSWTTQQGSLKDSSKHPYRKLIQQDIIREIIYQEAVRDHLTYFNVKPRLYQSTDILPNNQYETSEYVHFIETNFQSHYSVTMAFGINAYIQVTFFKTKVQGDFTLAEIEQLKGVYVYIATSYKNFKKFEQSKIVQNIQSKIITSGEKAFLVTDDFTHVMSYNQKAVECLTGILGSAIAQQIGGQEPCNWLPFLLGTSGEQESSYPQTRIIKNYVFKIHTFDQVYSNGIVDRYHWITIAKEKPKKAVRSVKHCDAALTPTEQRVVKLMCDGLTYKEIAERMIVSYHTVKKHVENIYAKCDINSRFELYQLFGREG
ncbi:putative HTH-type transcriptional regulator/MT0914 [Secundilactobacillus pentosiphilus]|uniref:HTH-type transcriptional regulator/MT0914 n=1 Tax=Secundilactobacillus pentosiphilus TaxID=1714682 RepID=A0A1Z5IR94_9LACO|nr:helix-turn-helix transcriptional regulator [Secundilactobacillus pentosiphilus]GAX04138.1 putative HTH-type transcriptional regulator/MT0914 [Secundilactobacillus pentosiphilus]